MVVIPLLIVEFSISFAVGFRRSNYHEYISRMRFYYESLWIAIYSSQFVVLYQYVWSEHFFLLNFLSFCKGDLINKKFRKLESLSEYGNMESHFVVSEPQTVEKAFLGESGKI